MRNILTIIALFCCFSAFAQESFISKQNDNYQFDNGKLVITFDDGLTSQYTTAFPMLQSEGVSATLYLIGNSPGNAGALTLAQISEMKNAGIDIECHTYDHPNLSSQTKTQVVAEMTNNNTVFSTNSLDYPLFIAYPSGLYNDSTKSWISPYRVCGRSAGTTFYPITRESEKYSLNTFFMDQITDPQVAAFKTQLDFVKANKLAAIIYSHIVTNDGSAGTKTSNLSGVIDYAKSIGMDIINIPQLYNLMRHDTKISTNPLTLTTTGTGAGVATLKITSTDDVFITLTGNGNFYTDAGGTTGATQTLRLSSGVLTTTYIKCTSGTSTLTLPTYKIVSISGWTASTNAPSISGIIDKFKFLTYLNIAGNNTLTGDVSNMPNLTYINLGTSSIGGSITGLSKLNNLWLTGSNGITGSITGLTDFSVLSISGNTALTGSITGLTNMVYLSVATNTNINGSVDALIKLTNIILTGTSITGSNLSGLTALTNLSLTGATNFSANLSGLSNAVSPFTVLANGNTPVTGDISGLIKMTSIQMQSTTNTLSGSISGLVNLTLMYLQGNNTCSGDIATLIKLQSIQVTGSNTITYSNATNLTALSYFYTAAILSSANVNQILADVWANKDATKVLATRQLELGINASSGAPTGAGITNKANLQAYRSPTPPGTAALWTVNTR